MEQQENNMDYDNTENSDEELKKEESEGCGCGTVIAILLVLALIIGIPSCISIKNSKEREAQRAYENSLPKAPDVGMTVEDLTKEAQSQIGKRIELTLGDFLTSTYTIHSIKCTDIRQFGVRKETLTVDYKAYSYYLDGQISFSKAEQYTYNFDSDKWEPKAGYVSNWIPDNVTINN